MEQQISNKNIVIGSLILLGVGIVIGRFTIPESIKTDKETAQVEVKANDIKKDTKTSVDKDRRTEKKIVELIKPDGTKETTTTIVEDVSLNKNKDVLVTDSSIDSKANTTKETKEIQTRGGKTHLNALIGSQFNITGNSVPSDLVFGFQGSQEILGPIELGGFGLVNRGLNNGACGLSLGVSF